MLDFTSALYLGLHHPSSSLGAWEALTLGRPAALQEPPGSDGVAAQLARLQGCEAATLLPSTLHLFWDLFRVLGSERVVILCDAAMYPIARWGVERAAAMGVPVKTFPHHDAEALARLALLAAEENRRPVVVTDGYCPGCGKAAPIRAYAETARRCDGYLVLDDTQALGILGDSPSLANPYGDGGGGSLRWHGTFGPHILTGASLAKGFGAPVAVLAGSHEWIDRFREDSGTRVHCSPPSVAVVYAAERALHVNRRHGDTLRRRLLHLVARLREQLAQAGFKPLGRHPFPVQSFLSTHWPPVSMAYQRLLQSGVTVLLTRACHALSTSLTFIVTARHRLAEIDLVGRIAAQAMRTGDGDLFSHAGVA
jgi:8-amino-7-oxononanoate synthase